VPTTSPCTEYHHRAAEHGGGRTTEPELRRGHRHRPHSRRRLGSRVAPGVVLAVSVMAAACGSANRAVTTTPASVLLVGTYHGIRGRYSSVDAAVAAAKPGDTILIAPGTYYLDPSHSTGLWIRTRDLHLIGMDRSRVVLDGNRPGTGTCNPARSAQDFGPPDEAASGKPTGRNGIWVYQAAGVVIENLTVCNFESGAQGNTGNQIWVDGGHGHYTTVDGQLEPVEDQGSFTVSYVTTYSTYAPDHLHHSGSTASYGIFVSNTTGPGTVSHSLGANMNDAGFYIGGCSSCGVTMDDDVSVHNVLGYSGTNSSGIVIEHSVFEDNKSGLAPNSQNNDDGVPPNDGACPPGRPPLVAGGTCEVIEHNLVADNNDPNVPGGQDNDSTSSVIGAGILLGGTENVTVEDNTVRGNGTGGIVVVDRPDEETPPPSAHCQGGVSLAKNFCIMLAFGNRVIGNHLVDNGGFGNPTNGGILDATLTTHTHPGNCFVGNVISGSTTATEPPDLQRLDGTCGVPNTGDLDSLLGVELACAIEFVGPCTSPSGVQSTASGLALIVGALHAPTTPLTDTAALEQASYRYPTITRPTAPVPARQPTMPDPCRGVPRNPWCP
jgi:parallel beta-helix repeat protein